MSPMEYVAVYYCMVLMSWNMESLPGKTLGLGNINMQVTVTSVINDHCFGLCVAFASVWAPFISKPWMAAPWKYSAVLLHGKNLWSSPFQRLGKSLLPSSFHCLEICHASLHLQLLHTAAVSVFSILLLVCYLLSSYTAIREASSY